MNLVDLGYYGFGLKDALKDALKNLLKNRVAKTS